MRSGPQVSRLVRLGLASLIVTIVLACDSRAFAEDAASAAGERARLAHVRALASAGQYVAMESLATVVIAAVEGAEHPDTLVLAEAYYSVCFARNLRRQYAEPIGLEAGLKSLRLMDAVTGAPDTLRSVAERQVGWTYMNQGMSASACGHFRSALAVARRHPEWGARPPTVILFNLGVALSNAGEADSAIALFREALVLRRAAGFPRDVLIGELHAVIGTAYEQLNRFDLAEESYTTGLREHVERVGPDNAVLNGVLSRMAAFEFRRGDYARSIDYSQRMLDILRPQSGPEDINVLVGEMAIAQALEQLGDVVRARDALERVVPKLETTVGFGNPQVMNGCLSLASAATKMEDLESARTIYRRIESFYAADSSRTERAQLAAALTSEAALSLEIGDLARARVAAAEAERVNRRAGSPDLSITLQALATQYQAAARTGDWSGADSLDARIDDELGRCALLSNNLTDDVWVARSRVARLRGRPAEAVAAAATGARLARERLVGNARGLSDRQALALSQTLSRALDELLAVGATADPASTRLCWDELVRARGVVRAEVARRRLPAWGRADTAFVARHSAWVEAERHLARLEVQVAAQARDPESEARLAAARSAVDEAERRLAREFPAAAPAAPADHVGLEAVMARLRPGQALVGFVPARGGDDIVHLLAFVACADPTRSGSAPVTVLDLGRLSDLSAGVAEWRARLAETRPAARSESACRKAGRVVRTALWDPIAAAAPGVEEFFLVPEAPVTGLPWGALPDGPRGYLVESGPRITVLDAERELLEESREPVGEGLLALGGADYDRAPDAAAVAPAVTGLVTPRVRRALSACSAPELPRFTSLPGTLSEVRAVEAAWASTGPGTGDAIRLEGERATEADFKRLAPRRGVLHLATHGVTLGDGCPPGATGVRGVGGVAPVGAAKKTRPAGRRKVTSVASGEAAETPQFSAWVGRRVLLALAGANQPPVAAADENEGLLTAEEVTTLDLRGVDWVVLSACHSAAGQSWSREGVLGLQRAFHLAGARTVIASQWSVDDDATREWMSALYVARARGARECAAAMATASREVLASRRAGGRSTHPFYWAAFTASGR